MGTTYFNDNGHTYAVTLIDNVPCYRVFDNGIFQATDPWVNVAKTLKSESIRISFRRALKKAAFDLTKQQS